MRHKLPLFLLFLCVLFVGKSVSIVRTEEISDCTRDTVNEYLTKYKLTCSDVLLDNALIKKVRECKDAACTNARLWSSKVDDVFSSLKPVVKENMKTAKNDAETLIENVKENAKIAHESATDIYGNIKENAKIAQDSASGVFDSIKENAKVAHDSASDIFGNIKENIKSAQDNANDVMENVKDQLHELKMKGQWTSDKAKDILDKAHHEALSTKKMTEKEWKKAYASLESLYKPVPWYQRFFRSKPTPAEQVNAKIDAFSQRISDQISHLGSLTKEQSQAITDQIRESIDKTDFEKMTDNEWVDSLTDILEKNTRFSKKDLKKSIDSLKSNYYEFKNDKIKYASQVLKDGMGYAGHAIKEGLDTASQVAKDAGQAAKEGADSASHTAKKGYDTASKIAEENYYAANQAAKENFESAKHAAKEKYESANQAAQESYDAASQAAKENIFYAEKQMKPSFFDNVKYDWNNFWFGIKKKVLNIDDLFRRGWPLYHNDPQKRVEDKYRSAKYIVQSATQGWEDSAKSIANDVRDNWDASTRSAQEGVYNQIHTATETATRRFRNKWEEAKEAKDEAERRLHGKWEDSKHAAEHRFQHKWDDAKDEAGKLHHKWNEAKEHHVSHIHHKWDDAKEQVSNLHHKWENSRDQMQHRIHNKWGDSKKEAKNLYNHYRDNNAEPTADVYIDEDQLPSDYADHIQTVYPIDSKPVNEHAVSSKLRQEPVDDSFASFWQAKEAAIYSKLGYTDTHIDWIKTYLERTFENKKSPVCGNIDEAAIVIKRYLDNIKIESPCEIEKTVDILKGHLESWRTSCAYN